MTHDPPLPLEVLLAASHARVSTRIGRWLVHDVRGPLQGVTLTLALLGEPGEAPAVDDELRGALRAAADDFSRIIDLVDQLLRLPRLDLAPGPVSLGETLADCERFLAHRRTRAELRWPDPATTAALPPIQGVAEQLRHALLGLLLLATDAAGAGPHGIVGLSCITQDAGVELRIVATPAPDDSEPVPPADPLLLDASRALLERSGGALASARTGGSATFAAHLARWHAGLDE